MGCKGYATREQHRRANSRNTRGNTKQKHKEKRNRTTKRKLDKLSKGLDNIPEVAGNKKMRRAGGPPKMY